MFYPSKVTVRVVGSKFKKDFSWWSGEKSILASRYVPSTISGRLQELGLPISRTYGGNTSIKLGKITIVSVGSVGSGS